MTQSAPIEPRHVTILRMLRVFGMKTRSCDVSMPRSVEVSINSPTLLLLVSAAAGQSVRRLERIFIDPKGTQMELLKTIDINPAFTPREGKATADLLISGDPSFKTWAQDVARGEMIHTGVWEATPGETRSIKGETFEFCHIISGVVEITPDGGKAVVYKAGDSFIMKPGFVGIWKTIETVRKIYVTIM